MFDISDRSDVKKNLHLCWMICTEAMRHMIINRCLPIRRKNVIGLSGYSQNGESYYLLTYNRTDRKFETILQEEVNGNTSQGILGNLYRRYAVCDQRKYY